MLYSDYEALLERLQKSGDDASLERYHRETFKLAEAEPSKENIMLAALCLLYLVRLNTVRGQYSRMRAFSNKLIGLLEERIKDFPDSTEFYAILGIVNGNIANKTPVSRFPIKMKHGLRGILYYKKATRMNEKNKYVLLCGIGHSFNAPRLMGGDPNKGLLMAKLHNEIYKADEWVDYLLADIYMKLDINKSRQIVKDMLDKNPRSFFAESLKKEMDGI